MTYLEFQFERGGTLRAKLNESAERTIACIRRDLPRDKTVYQARWSGREIFVPVQLREKPPRECQSIRAGIGDVIYFTEWADGYDQTGFEAIGMFYGNEIVREWRGESAVNVFAHIDESQWDVMREIGERVWRRGGEAIAIRLVDDNG
jgi:hypothetical protein